MRRLPALLLSLLLPLSLTPTAAFAHGGFADPDAITVGPGAEFASWTGGPYATSTTIAGCPGSEDDPDQVCDYLDLQVAVDGKFWGSRDGRVEIVIAWENGESDFDLRVVDGEGNEVAESAAGGSGPETVTIDEPAGSYEIQVTPWLMAGPTSYEGSITFVAEDAVDEPGLDDPRFDEVMTDAPCVDGVSNEMFACDGIDLTSFLPISELGGEDGDEVSDIWGWTDPATGAEIAIVGLISGTAFVDVTDPFAPETLAFMDNSSPTPSIWHDYKVIGDVVYAVSESNAHELQMLDLTRLRDVSGGETIQPDATIDAFPGDAHNIITNEDTGRIYSVGTNVCDGGALVFDVDEADGGSPLDPAFLGCVAQDGYTHDAQCVVYDGPDADHRGKEICVNSNEDTLTVVDVTEVGIAGQNTVQLSRTPYENNEYTHQGWLTEDHRYFLLGDELDEQRAGVPTTTYIWDLADLDAPVLVNAFEHETAAIDHNLYIRDGLAYQSNYEAGLRIQDLSRLAQGQLDEVAFFDTYPAGDAAEFNGTWSNYPYFASGTLVVTGINEGLFVLRRSEDATPSEVERLSGGDRFATAAAISRDTFAPGVDVAYVATGRGFADALTGGPLAAANDAPILLTEPDGLPAATMAELERLRPGRIVVLGGDLAVSGAVETALASYTEGNVTRIAGGDRFETAAAILAAFPGDVDAVGIATGADFPDALAGGALAADNDGAILLTRRDELPTVTAEALEARDLTTIAVLGGEQAVSSEVQVALGAFADETVLRLAGGDRFQTATAMLAAFSAAPTTVFVATGTDFPDAVAGTSAAGAVGGSLLLVRRDEVPSSTAAVLAQLRPTRIVILGGEGAVGPEVATQLATYLR